MIGPLIIHIVLGILLGGAGYIVSIQAAKGVKHILPFLVVWLFLPPALWIVALLFIVFWREMVPFSLWLVPVYWAISTFVVVICTMPFTKFLGESEKIPAPRESSGIAVGEKSVWILSWKSGELLQVDPHSGEVTERIPLGALPNSVAVGEGYVWVTNTRYPVLTKIDQANAGDNTLLKIDPATKRIVTKVPLDGIPGGLAVGEGAVWLGISKENIIWRIDPVTCEVVASIKITMGRFDSGPQITNVAVGEGSVWVTEYYNDRLSQIDPAKNLVVSSIKVGRAPCGVVVGEKAVWVTGKGSHQLFRIDPLNHVVSDEPIPVGKYPVGVAFFEGAVWVTNTGDNTVSKIDSKTGQVTQTIPVDIKEPQGIVVVGHSLWVVSWNDFARIIIEP